MIIIFITLTHRGRDDMATVYLREFPKDLHKRAKLQAVKEETSLKGIIIKALEQYLKKVGE